MKEIAIENGIHQVGMGGRRTEAYERTQVFNGCTPPPRHVLDALKSARVRQHGRVSTAKPNCQPYCACTCDTPKCIIYAHNFMRHSLKYASDHMCVATC